MSSILKLEHCYKEFGENVVLKDVNLHVNTGDKIALIGESGSGKTTLLNIIGLMDESTQGIYSLYGRIIDDLSDHELSSIRGDVFSFVFQAYHLVDKLTVEENITLPFLYKGFECSKEKLKSIMEKSGVN